MIVYSSGVIGMIATEKKGAVPANDDIFKVEWGWDGIWSSAVGAQRSWVGLGGGGCGWQRQWWVWEGGMGLRHGGLMMGSWSVVVVLWAETVFFIIGVGYAVLNYVVSRRCLRILLQFWVRDVIGLCRGRLEHCWWAWSSRQLLLCHSCSSGIMLVRVENLWEGTISYLDFCLLRAPNPRPLMLWMSV